MTLSAYDLGKLNSLTKYPSIATYHEIGERGRLTERYTPLLGQVFGTEKVDGTNARIVLLGDDYLIGSREELLTAKGDRIANPQMGIVATLRDIAERLSRTSFMESWPLTVVYGEVYGNGVNSKQYGNGSGFRAFDVARFTSDGLHSLVTLPREEIARWRDGGSTPFIDQTALWDFCCRYSLDMVPLVCSVPGGDVPTGHADVYDWMKRLLPISNVMLESSAPGRPEGLVLRSGDRRQIVKLRFEDYERALKGKR